MKRKMSSEKKLFIVGEGWSRPEGLQEDLINENKIREATEIDLVEWIRTRKCDYIINKNELFKKLELLLYEDFSNVLVNEKEKIEIVRAILDRLKGVL